MTTQIWTANRVAGVVLASTFLFLVAALFIMLVRDAGPGFGPMIGGDLSAAAPYAETFRLLILIFVLSWVAHLVGVGLLCRILARAGQGQLAVAAFTLILVTVVTAVFSYSFRMTFELSAAQEAARTGTVPALFEPLKDWTSSAFRLGYRLHFTAMILIGWAILRSGLLSPAFGWATIGWSGLWLLAAFAGAGAPAIPLIMPAVLGIALTLSRA